MHYTTVNNGDELLLGVPDQAAFNQAILGHLALLSLDIVSRDGAGEFPETELRIPIDIVDRPTSDDGGKLYERIGSIEYVLATREVTGVILKIERLPYNQPLVAMAFRDDAGDWTISKYIVSTPDDGEALFSLRGYSALLERSLTEVLAQFGD